MIVVNCELGHRTYSEKFKTKQQASAFVNAIFKDEPLKWKSPSEATAKGGVLVMRSKELENLVDMYEELQDEEKVLPDEVTTKCGDFLNGHWKNNDETPKVKVSSAIKTKKEPAGLVTLAELCKRNKWTPRLVRAKLRSFKAKKSVHGWAWTSSEAAKIEKQLKETFA